MDELNVDGLTFASYLIDAGEAEIDWLKVLGYGPSGAGKTSVLSSMPDPLIVLLTEKHGAMTIKRVNPNAKIIFIEDTLICTCHNGPVAKCSSPKGEKKISGQQVLNGVLDELSTKKHPFRSVVLDSLTDMQQILLSDMKGGKPGAQVSLQEWGKLIDRTKHLVVRLRNLNMHVGVICLADEVQDNNQKLIYRPALAGKKLPGNLIQYFNLCFFQRKQRDSAAVDGATYESVFDSGPEYYTKTHPALDPVEVSNARLWVDKISKYALAHGEGDMPTVSSPVSRSEPEPPPPGEDPKSLLVKRIEQKSVKDLFERLEAAGVPAPRGRRIKTAETYVDDDELKRVLKKKIKEAENEKSKKGNGK